MDSVDHQTTTQRPLTLADMGERVLQNAPVIILLLDPAGLIQFVNPHFARVTGYSPEDVHGKDWFMTCLPEREREPTRRLFRGALDGPATRNNVTPILTRSGEEREIEWSDEVQRGASGEVTGLLCIGQDVTERLWTERALREREALVSTVIRGAPLVIFALDPEGRFTLSDGKALALIGLSPGQVVGQSAFELYADVPGMAENLRRALGGETVHYRASVGPVWVDTTYSPRFRPDGTVDGVIGVAFDITAQQHAEAALGRARDHLDGTLQALPDLLFEVGEDGHIVGFHANHVERLVVPPDGFLGKTFHDVLPLAAADACLGAVQAAARDGHALGALYELEVGGEVRWFEPSVARKGSALGDEPRFILLARDVTDRVRATDELRASRERLNEAQALAQVGSWELDLRTNRLVWSDEIFRIFEIDPGEFGASYEAFLATIHPDDRARVDDAYTRSVSRREPYTITHRLLMPSRSVKYVQERGETYYAADGTPVRSVGIVQDITVRALAEEALLATREQLEATLQAIPDLLFEIDEEGRYLSVRAQRPELLTAPESDVLGRTMAEILPADAAEVAADALREAAATGCSFGRSFRLPLPDGPHWFELSVARKASSRGLVPTYVVLSRDVTERKQTERALVDSEARYRSVVEAMNDGIVVHAADGAIVTANAAAERILGLTVDQMMGRTSLDPRWRSIREDGSPFPGEEHPGWVTLHTGESRTGVIMGVHKPSGELTWISITSRRVTPLGEEGAYSVVASFADVTQQRRADEGLRASLREKEALLKEIHHRVKNNLQIISSLLHLQSTQSADPAVRALFEESRTRVRSMALVHELLCQSEDLSRVDFAQYLHQVTRSLVTAHQSPSVRLTVQVDPPDAALDIQVAIPCGLITNELVTNVLKHAFPGDAAGEIQVSFSQAAGGGWVLSVADNGGGLPETVNPQAPSTLGLRLVQTLTNQLDAVMCVERAGGTRFEFTFAR